MINRAYFAQPSRFSGAEIIPGLFLGNAKMANSNWILNQLNIKVIVNCAFEVKSPLAGVGDYQHYFLYLDDSYTQDLQETISRILPIIDQHLNKKEKVLIHCAQGISRSASILAAYLMWKRKLPFAKALKMIQEKRVIANPNLSFQRQLKAFEQKILTPKDV